MGLHFYLGDRRSQAKRAPDEIDPLPALKSKSL